MFVHARRLQLREEILPLLWRDSGLRAADYELVLQMLSCAGVLFVADESPNGRRWVMPTRLPEERPYTLQAQMLEPRPDEITQSFIIELGHWSPPGLMERILAGCYALGRYHKYWRRGVRDCRSRLTRAPPPAILIEACFPHAWRALLCACVALRRRH